MRHQVWMKPMWLPTRMSPAKWSQEKKTESFIHICHIFRKVFHWLMWIVWEIKLLIFSLWLDERQLNSTAFIHHVVMLYLLLTTVWRVLFPVAVENLTSTFPENKSNFKSTCLTTTHFQYAVSRSHLMWVWDLSDNSKLSFLLRFSVVMISAW